MPFELVDKPYQTQRMHPFDPAKDSPATDFSQKSEWIEWTIATILVAALIFIIFQIYRASYLHLKERKTQLAATTSSDMMPTPDKEWGDTTKRRKANEKREVHGAWFTVAFFVLSGLLSGFLRLADRDSEAGHSFLTILSLMASYGFWKWWMTSSFIDRKYNSSPEDKNPRSY